ncbi:MAG TPA: site-2 protease family protein [Thermoanaerobaculia bacterium]|nr:site-2 protease family protein [Thermoanaerobaculia bacterium]
MSCPVCHALVHAEELKRLAGEAEAAEREERPVEALTAWRQALGLLPPDSRQATVVAGRLEALSRRIESDPATAAAAAAADPATRPRTFAGAWKQGGIGATVLLLLSKGKLLLLGLTKIGTLFSMLAFLGVYWALFGWQLALGIVISIYVHEMGHVWELRRFGIAASAPMFIPGFGALVRLKQRPANAREDARIGLAGPLWGLAAAAVAWGVHQAGGGPIWAAIARLGAWINLFNLIPFWQLDGGRGFHPLSRSERLLAAGAIGLALWGTGEKMLWLLLLAALAQAFFPKQEGEGDGVALAWYVFLVAALSALLMVRVPGVG